ncbi:MAG: hypothetical protein PHP37_04050 [Patescibacteria group bacterium]|nr:hypothetical protein [Patescibacteria group bacterium]
MKRRNSQKEGENLKTTPPYEEPNTTSLLITIIIVLIGSGIFTLLYLIIKNIK